MRPSRITGLDAARGVALVGMVAVHVTPGGSPGDPVPVAHVVAGGRASALFAVLAGCGLALATGGAQPWTGRRLAGARRAVAARAAVVAAVGLTVGGLSTPAAVILAYYGVLFLVAVPVLGWGPRRLAVTAVCCAVVTPVVSHLVRRASPRGPGPNVSWADAFVAPGDLLRTLVLDGYYPVLTWTTYLLAGLAVGRLALGSGRVAARVAVTGLVLAAAGLAIGALTLAAAGGPARLGRTTGESPDAVLHRLATSSYGTSPTTSWWWLGTAGRHSGTTPDLVHTTGSALAVLGGLVLLAAAADRAAALGHRLGRRTLAPLVALGTTTLTLYALHVMLLGASADRAWLREVGAPTLVVAHVAFAVVVVALVGAPARRGPLEALAAAAGRCAAGSVIRSGLTPRPEDADPAQDGATERAPDRASDPAPRPDRERGAADSEP